MLAAPRSSGSSKWERAASGDALVTKTVSDVPIEIDAFGCGGHQILKNGGWNAEVAVNRASAKLQLERFISGVNGRLEQGRIQRIETLGVGHGAIYITSTPAAPKILDICHGLAALVSAKR